MTKKQQRAQTPKAPRWFLCAWFHLETDTIVTCAQCHQRPGEARMDDYQPTPDMERLKHLSLGQAADVVHEALLRDQIQHGPRIHRSESWCFHCVAEHFEMVFQGTPDGAGWKALVALTRFDGHPGVAIVYDNKTSTNIMEISVKDTIEALYAEIDVNVAETLDQQARKQGGN
jgi:hypothetical protein